MTKKEKKKQTLKKPVILFFLKASQNCITKEQTSILVN